MYHGNNSFQLKRSMIMRDGGSGAWRILTTEGMRKLKLTLLQLATLMVIV